MLGRLRDLLLTFGVPGLLLIAFADSAGVPMAGGPDAVVLLLSWQTPARIHWILLAATAGSTLGCLVLQQIGRKGGEVALARFGPAVRERVVTAVRRNGVMAVLLAVLAPPPFPTKLAILAAGVVQMKRGPFAATVFAGRLVRYGGEGLLAVRFGDRAAEVLRDQYPLIAVALVAAAIAWWGGRRLWRKREG
jgi:membrane protein YqaA with SNARE-associated domain